jgi:hypothetical protein
MASRADQAANKAAEQSQRWIRFFTAGYALDYSLRDIPTLRENARSPVLLALVHARSSHPRRNEATPKPMSRSAPSHFPPPHFRSLFKLFPATALVPLAECVSRLAKSCPCMGYTRVPDPHCQRSVHYTRARRDRAGDRIRFTYRQARALCTAQGDTIKLGALPSAFHVPSRRPTAQLLVG